MFVRCDFLEDCLSVHSNLFDKLLYIESDVTLPFRVCRGVSWRPHYSRVCCIIYHLLQAGHPSSFHLVITSPLLPVSSRKFRGGGGNVTGARCNTVLGRGIRWLPPVQLELGQEREFFSLIGRHR